MVEHKLSSGIGMSGFEIPLVSAFFSCFYMLLWKSKDRGPFP